MFQYKKDFEEVFARYEAWWNCEVLDRPLVSFTYAKPEADRVPGPPPKTYDSHRERWLDIEYRADCTAAHMANAVFAADALPTSWPNLGPEIFSAFYGCPMEFGESTSWSEPILKDWSEESLNALQLDWDHFYLRKILEFTDLLIERGRGKFMVGYTDIHPGADAVAAFRDPQMLCLDMIEHPQEVKRLVDRVTKDFFKVYDLFHERLQAAGMPSTTWLSATGNGKYHVPSNDFSCMISDAMFEEIFLPGIIEECAFMDRCIYHLDGPQALRYLDTLLAIPEIHAIQWVPGSGQSHWSQWIHVYQRIQEAGKAFVVYLPAQDLAHLFEVLKPEGAWLSLHGVNSQEEGEQVLRQVASWSIW